MANPARALIHVVVIVGVVLLVVMGAILVLIDQIAQIVKFFLGVMVGV